MHKENENGETVTHVSPTEARSGASSHVVRYVLGISLVLVIIAFAVILGFGFLEPAQTGSDGMLGNTTTQPNQSTAG